MFPTDERDARLLLWLHPAIGPARFYRLLEAFGSGVRAVSASASEWARLDVFGSEVEEHHRHLARLPDVLEKEKKRVNALGACLVTDLDAPYPAPFRELRDAPPVLCLWGTLVPEDARSVALVGSRQATAYGCAVAERLAREFAQAGVTVVSGLARGIDTAAHAACVAAGGRTIGILGGGLDHFYPKENRRLADRIAARGAVVTEFPLDARPEPNHFPRRNRLIAALSMGVIVVEAQEKSGALITAKLAAEQGKDVFAVPGPVFSPGSRGPHFLLKQGAKPVESAADVLEEIPALQSAMKERDSLGSVEESPAGTSPFNERLLAVLGVDPLSVDVLSQKTGAAASAIVAALLTLELSGLVRELPGKLFVLTERALPAVGKGSHRG